MRCFEVISRLSRFPVTAKMRILDEEDAAPSVKLASGLASLGARAITVHGRTRKSFYTGTVHFDIISAIRTALPEVEVIANGGVHTVDQCREIREKSGCSRVMLAQGAMGNPWLFREIETGCEAPDIEEWRDMVMTHVSDMVALYGEFSGMRQARKIVHDYLKGRGFGGAAKSKASLLSNLEELRELVYSAAPVAVSPQRKIRYSPLLSENTN
jgi:tRNA-dihydrouridine synthase B